MWWLLLWQTNNRTICVVGISLHVTTSGKIEISSQTKNLLIFVFAFVASTLIPTSFFPKIFSKHVHGTVAVRFIVTTTAQTKISFQTKTYFSSSLSPSLLSAFVGCSILTNNRTICGVGISLHVTTTGKIETHLKQTTYSSSSLSSSLFSVSIDSSLLSAPTFALPFLLKQ